MTKVLHTIADVRTLPHRPRAVIMTMGALHDGHLDMVTHARQRVGDEGDVLVTIFVNPLQFGPDEDFDRYPRTLDDDVAACAERGVDVVFCPDVPEMYPNGPGATTVVPGPLGSELEGEVRPTHFAGVLTVVMKLLNITEPDVALFGEKDYQQLTLIRQMVHDLNMNVEILGVPTVREADGLAMSSRNRYLNTDQRAAAGNIPKAMAVGRAAAAAGASPEDIETAVQAELRGVGDVTLEPQYIEVRGEDLGPPPHSGPARLLLAVGIGELRLIDNCALELAIADGGRESSEVAS